MPAAGLAWFAALAIAWTDTQITSWPPTWPPVPEPADVSRGSSHGRHSALPMSVVTVSLRVDFATFYVGGGHERSGLAGLSRRRERWRLGGVARRSDGGVPGAVPRRCGAACSRGRAGAWHRRRGCTDHHR